MRTRGFTLIELMVSLALMAVLATLCATVAASAREDDRVAREYAEDLRHLRTASDVLAAEIRSAHDVAVDADALVIDGRRWSVSDGVLLRNGVVAVRGIASLDASPTDTGAWRIGVTPVARRPGAKAPALVTSARPRAEVTR